MHSHLTQSPRETDRPLYLKQILNYHNLLKIGTLLLMHALLIKQQITDLTLKKKVWKVILVAFQGHRQDFSRGVQFAENLLTTPTFWGGKTTLIICNLRGKASYIVLNEHKKYYSTAKLFLA